VGFLVTGRKTRLTMLVSVLEKSRWEWKCN